MQQRKQSSTSVFDLLELGMDVDTALQVGAGDSEEKEEKAAEPVAVTVLEQGGKNPIDAFLKEIREEEKGFAKLFKQMQRKIHSTAMRDHPKDLRAILRKL